MELADPKYKFDDTFTVKSRDNEKFVKVPRIACEGQSFGASLEIDIYDELFPLKEGDNFFLALTDSVSNVQRADEGVRFNTIHFFMRHAVHSPLVCRVVSHATNYFVATTGMGSKQ